MTDYVAKGGINLMSILDKIKKNIEDTIDRAASKPEYQYERAYEKGVDVHDYGSAAKDFRDAGKKFEKQKNTEMALRAKANSSLYQLINSKDRLMVNEAIIDLEELPEIEQFGIRNTLVNTDSYVLELKAIQIEHQAELAQSNDEKRKLYTQAKDLLMKLDGNSLSFADKINIPGPTDKALSRAFYYGAFSDFYGGIIETMNSPANAHDLLKKSFEKLSEFGAVDKLSEVKEYLDNIELKRHCWVCGREMQGRNIHYHYYPTSTTRYHKNFLESSGDDLGMLDKEGYVTLCTVCGLLIEKQADIYSTEKAEEIKEWIEPILKGLISRMNSIENVQKDLEYTQSDIEDKQIEVQSDLEHTQRDIENKQRELQRELESNQEKLEREAHSRSHTETYDRYGNKLADSYSDGHGHTESFDKTGNKLSDSYKKRR
jgi:hypothetical protein